MLPGGRPLSLGGFTSLLLAVRAAEATAVSDVVPVVAIVSVVAIVAIEEDMKIVFF